MLVVGVLAAGCSVGNNADAFGGGYALVSPGGKTELSYAGPARRPIGELSGPDLINDGATVAVSAYPGKVVVVNFWGSWCAPCRAEADGLNTAARSLARQGVQFIGVDIKDTRAGGADFHTGKKVPYPSIFDSTMRTLLSLRGYPASAIPSTIVLDRSHRVSHVWLLPVTADQLLRVVAPIAAEKS